MNISLSMPFSYLFKDRFLLEFLPPPLYPKVKQYLYRTLPIQKNFWEYRVFPVGVI